MSKVELHSGAQREGETHEGGVARVVVVFGPSLPEVEMAWRGRDKTKQSSFAFGSSTPRDLSYMHKVPARSRAYDAPPPADKPVIPPISVFVRKAHTREPPPVEQTNSPANVAFGSGTPRQFTHLEKVPKSLRVYNAALVTKTIHRSTTAPPVKRNHHRPPLPSDQDDVASEPDMVQDRRDFFDEMREKREKRIHNEQKTTKEEPCEETTEEIVQHTQVIRIEGEIQEEPARGTPIQHSIRDDTLTVHHMEDVGHNEDVVDQGEVVIQQEVKGHENNHSIQPTEAIYSEEDKEEPKENEHSKEREELPSAAIAPCSPPRSP